MDLLHAFTSLPPWVAVAAPALIIAVALAFRRRPGDTHTPGRMHRSGSSDATHTRTGPQPSADTRITS